MQPQPRLESALAWLAALSEEDLARVPADLQPGLRLARSAAGRAAELEELAWRDPLTSLWNRRGVEQCAAALLAQAERHEFAVSALLLDIDRFKSVNDRLGHSAGDAVLRLLAAELARAARAGDVVARWGGDEFLVLLPYTSAAGARVALTRLQQQADAVLASECRALETAPRLAGGWATGPAARLEQLVDAADRELYRQRQRAAQP